MRIPCAQQSDMPKTLWVTASPWNRLPGHQGSRVTSPTRNKHPRLTLWCSPASVT